MIVAGHSLAIGFCAVTVCVLLGCANPPPPAPAPSPRPLAAQVESLRLQGHRWMARGDLAHAEEVYEEARQIAESLDDVQGLIVVLNDLGQVALSRGKTGEAIMLHEQAVTLAQQVVAPDLLIGSLTAAGAAEHREGRMQEAERRSSGNRARRYTATSPNYEFARGNSNSPSVGRIVGLRPLVAERSSAVADPVRKFAQVTGR